MTVRVGLAAKAERSETMRFASQELRRLLAAVTGDRVVILDVASPRDDVILLEVQPDLGSDPLDDVIEIAIDGVGGVVRGSNERSVLIAVYRYLSELGCQFVHPGVGGELLPQVDLAATRVTLSERAAHRHRGICIEGASSLTNLLDLVDWMPKVGFNSYVLQFDSPYTFLRGWYERDGDPSEAAKGTYPHDGTVDDAHRTIIDALAQRSLVHHAVGHGWTAAAIGVQATGWDTVTGADFDTSLVAEVNGVRALWTDRPLNTELCYSNPEARRRMVHHIVEHAAAHPEIDLLHIWLSDGSANQCECAVCAQARPADWYVEILNEVDTALTAQGIPTRIALLAYNQLLWPPVMQRLQDESRFVFMFAPIQRNHTVPILEGVRADTEIPPYEGNITKAPWTGDGLVALLRGWQEVCSASSFDFDYHLMWQYYLDPGSILTTRVLAEDIQALQGLGLDGLVGCHPQRIAVPTAFALAVEGRFLWDPSTDFDEFADAYFATVLGADGPAVLARLSEASRIFAGWNVHLRCVTPPTVSAAEVEAMVEVFASLQELVAKNLESDPSSIAWTNLEFHVRIWQLFLPAWTAVADNQPATVLERVDTMRQAVWAGQDDVQDAFDGKAFCAAVDSYFRRLYSTK